VNGLAAFVAHSRALWLERHREITEPRRHGYPLRPEAQAREYAIRKLLTFHFGVTFHAGLHGHEPVLSVREAFAKPLTPLERADLLDINPRR
jgi:hypothetical protein